MKEKIAIIGLGCIFPDAPDFTQYWRNIVEGKDSIREVEPDFWSVADFYDPDPNAPDKTYCKRGAPVDPIEFDAREFGVSPKVMEHTSVEQIFSLVVARQALIDAGYYGTGCRPFNKEKTGVILSAPAGRNAFQLCSRSAAPNLKTLLLNNGIPDAAADVLVDKYLRGLPQWTEDDNPGYIGNVAAGRIANRFDLGGTCCSVDAACGSSMGAIKFAVDELQNGNCDVMLCGGANLDNSAFAYISFCKTPAISKTSQIKPFDESADGMLLGDGVGMMVLKRLSDAQRDGDRIYALICGTGASSDGRAKSIYAPNKEGQKRCLGRAYADARVDMSTVGLLEAHGTGTAAGDACEVSAVAETFPRSQGRNLVIGSVKSQIGHMRMAAGVGGAIKTALALYHKVLPGSIHMEDPNPALVDSSLTVLQKSVPWTVNARQPVRRAGVSAFGFGGTNFHVVMEEYENDHRAPYRAGPMAVVLTAHSKQALVEKLEALAADAAAFTQAVYRYENAGNGAYRLGFVARDVSQAAEKCAAALKLLKENDAPGFTTGGIAYREKPLAGKVTLLFPGQGTQGVNMLRHVAMGYPEMRRSIARGDDVLLGQDSAAVSELLYPKALTRAEKNAAQAAISRTENTQPVLAAVEAGLYQIAKRRGVRADMLLGHSFGELVALWADGVMDFDTLMSMSRRRGSLMGKTDPDTAMLAVMTDRKTLANVCDGVADVYIANENSPRQQVISGDRTALAAVAKTLAEQNIPTAELKVSGAFHSPYMQAAAREFRTYLDELELGAGTGAVIANTTGMPHTGSIPRELEAQLLQPVRFAAAAEYAYEAGSRIFVEVGSGKVLTGLVQDCLAGKDLACVPLCPDKSGDTLEQLEFAMAQLFVLGLPIEDDPYRAPYNEELVIRKSKSTYTVSMNGFRLPETQKAMDEALAPDDQLAPMLQTKEVATVPNINQTSPGEVFSKFMDAQLSQMQAASQMLAYATTEQEKQNILACVTLFQNNAMRAYEACFGNFTPAPAAPMPTFTPAQPPLPPEVPEEPAEDQDLYGRFLNAIVEKTGYPADMIDETMELESDLGIDSIKRVEIFAAVFATLERTFTAEELEPLSELTDIGSIVAYLRQII